MNRVSRLDFDRTHADLLTLRQARPTRIRSQLVDWPTVYVGGRPRRSLRARLGSIWTRFNAASWRDPFALVLWIGVLLAGARVGGLL